MIKKPILTSLVFLGVLSMLVSGCATSDQVLVQPRIEGRVIDATTMMPIEDVVIVRNPNPTVPGDDEYLSAGDVPTRQVSIYTNRDGEFKVGELDEDSDGVHIWTSVTLKFLHPDYQMYSAEFNYSDIMMEVGDLVLQTGDIMLHRLPMPMVSGN